MDWSIICPLAMEFGPMTALSPDISAPDAHADASTATATTASAFGILPGVALTAVIAAMAFGLRQIPYVSILSPIILSIAIGMALLWGLSLSPHDLEVLVGCITALMIGTALLYPWGGFAQAIVSGFLAIGFSIIFPWHEYDAARAVNVVIPLALGVGLSVIGAAILERRRRAQMRLVRDLEEEGEIPQLPAAEKGKRFAAMVEAAANGAMLKGLERACDRLMERFDFIPSTVERLAEPFEQLRAASDRAMSRVRARPPVFLANLG